MRVYTHVSLLSGLLLSGFLLLILCNTVFAHGAAHKEENQMSEHMQAMMSIKETIPEEYRVMERTPVFQDEESLQEGQKLFLQNCSVCHGESGNGKGPAAAALSPSPANFLDKKHSDIYGPGEKFWLIGHGSGETGMPAFKHLQLLQRWHLVNYILHLQEKELTEK